MREEAVFLDDRRRVHKGAGGLVDTLYVGDPLTAMLCGRALDKLRLQCLPILITGMADSMWDFAIIPV